MDQEVLLKTVKGNLFVVSFDQGTGSYVAAGPHLGGTVVPVQGQQVKISVDGMGQADALEVLRRQLGEMGY